MESERIQVFEWLMGATMSFDSWSQARAYHKCHGFKVQLETEIHLGNLPFTARLPVFCIKCHTDMLTEDEIWPSPSMVGGFECTACCCSMIKEMPPASDIRSVILTVNGLHRTFNDYEQFREEVMRVAHGLTDTLCCS